MVPGYYVDMEGKNAKKITEYIQRNRLKEDQVNEQLMFKEYTDPFTGGREYCKVADQHSP